MAEMAAPTTVITVQQQQASTNNHPCGNLLDRERRRDYLNIAVPLFTALITGDLEAGKAIIQGHEYLVRYSITERKETPLHVAAAGHSIEFVSYLVNMMSMVDMELQNADGNTAFCIASISGNVSMLKIMLEKNRALPIICGSENKTPLYLAVFHGNYDTVTFLYDESGRMKGDKWTNDVVFEVLLKCIQTEIFDVALRILEDNVELPQDKDAWDVLHVLARKPWAFFEIRNPIKSLFANVYKVRFKESNATILLRFLWKRIMEKPKDIVDEIIRGPMIEKDNNETYPSQILFTAAKMKNTYFLVVLIRAYPDLIWKRNDDGQTIFHISVSHRCIPMYRLLLGINGSTKNLIAAMTDQQGNNILHLVGKKPEKYAYEGLMTAPFQMYSEYLWYKKVTDILPPACIEVKNAEGQTPHELFDENHKNLASEAMKSINETINLSMVVAALVCTIGFSVVFQIPGGFDQNNGFPMFHRNKYFIAFVITDVMSFIFATSSIFCFLSIILSRHHGYNMEFLYRTWISGQLTLLGSVFFLVGTFFISFLILYPKRKWTYILDGFAIPLIIIYGLVCIRIINDAAGAILDAKNYFRPMPKEYGLFSKNR